MSKATRLKHLAQLDLKKDISCVGLSGVICTIGPASANVELLEKMIENGMTIARWNFSHGSHEYHAHTIKCVRDAVSNLEKRTNRTVPVAIALDTKGPEIRTGYFEEGIMAEIELMNGDSVKLTTNKDFAKKCTADVIYVDYEDITKAVEVGSKVYINDGAISVIVNEIGNDYLICQIEHGGHLSGKKCVNLPGTLLNLPSVSQEDREDLLFGLEQGVDMIFASFTRNADGVRQIRKVLSEQGKDILVISKIEDHQGMENIDEIIAESDGIMIARSDLATEMPPEKVFVAQKAIIARCNVAGKPVVCATQMLESMIKKTRPTRAEGSDAANAILDGADCIMVSAETAKGEHPLDCVKTMATICREAEAVMCHRELFDNLLDVTEKPIDHPTSVAIAAVEASYNTNASAIIVVTSSGKISHLVAKYRPRCPVFAVTENAQVARQCHLFRGIIPIHYSRKKNSDWAKGVDECVEYALQYGKQRRLVQFGDSVIIVAGWREGEELIMRVLTVEETRST